MEVPLGCNAEDASLDVDVDRFKFFLELMAGLLRHKDQSLVPFDHSKNGGVDFPYFLLDSPELALRYLDTAIAWIDESEFSLYVGLIVLKFFFLAIVVIRELFSSICEFV